MIYKWGDVCDSREFEHDQQFVEVEHWKEACDEVDDLRKTKRELESELAKQRDRINHLEMVVKKINDDYWFMINLIERYLSNKEDALKDVLERMKFRKPLLDKALAKVDEVLK